MKTALILLTAIFVLSPSYVKTEEKAFTNAEVKEILNAALTKGYERGYEDGAYRDDLELVRLSLEDVQQLLEE